MCERQLLGWGGLYIDSVIGYIGELSRFSRVFVFFPFLLCPFNEQDAVIRLKIKLPSPGPTDMDKQPDRQPQGELFLKFGLPKFRLSYIAHNLIFHQNIICCP